MNATGTVWVEPVKFGGWENCHRLTNGEVELVVTADVGPRIIRCGFVGGQNLFGEFPGELGRSGEPRWKLRGGHRLWVAPEVEEARSPITYAADNGPVRIDEHDDGLTATPGLEAAVGIQKQITVRMSADGGITVTHRITNANKSTVEVAAWALTIVTPGGWQITGLPPRGTHPETLAPSNPLTMWAFTHLDDPRWKFLRKYILLHADPGNPVPQKIGHFNVDTWGAYWLGGDLFIKRYAADPSKAYPDLGASYETFTNGSFLELETLGPLTKLAPGETLEHVERWGLFRGVAIDAWTDEAIDRALLPRLAEVG